MAEGMGVSVKTEKEDSSGKTVQIRGSTRPPQWPCYGGWKGGSPELLDSPGFPFSRE